MIKISNLSNSVLAALVESINDELSKRKRTEGATQKAYDNELLQADQNLAEKETELSKNSAKLFAELKDISRSRDEYVQKSAYYKKLADETTESMSCVQTELSYVTRALNEIKLRREKIHQLWIQNHPVR